MTVLPAETTESVGAATTSTTAEDSRQAPGASVLITEQQVLFSTAVTTRRPTTADRSADAVRVVATAVHGLFERPNSPVIPPRSRRYYESSLISRERARL
ncbi:MAG: hypothetical protein ACRDU5_18235 [Mycobacterium sp.]